MFIHHDLLYNYRWTRRISLLFVLVGVVIWSAPTEAATTTNPFEKGCLITMAERYGDTGLLGPNSKIQQRVCNSDDKRIGDYDSCRIPAYDKYFEVRTATGDWDESIILGWIYQILLSEVMGVPSTIEGGTKKGFKSDEDDSRFSFYDKKSRYVYPSATYNFNSLVEADKQNGDCARSTTSKDCAHIIPSLYEGGKSDIAKHKNMGHLLPDRGNGVIGGVGLHIPLATAKKDGNSLVSYFGLQGDENRKKMANMFRIPTNWKTYCSLHNSNCIAGDDVADHAPNSEEEEKSYFMKGLYKGYFRIDDDINNCTIHPHNCTGHVVAPTCEWTNYIEAQLYWNNITLTSQGPLLPNKGYSYDHMVQIYHAANETKSDVFFFWWSPETLMESYHGTDYEFYRVTLPQPTRQCLNYRSNGNIDKCSDNLADRLGDNSIGSCDYATESLTQVMSRGFVTATQAGPMSMQSPAYEFMKNVRLPPFPIRSILQGWNDLGNVESMNRVSDPKREGVCKWVYDNIDHFLDYVPKGYPRTLNIVTHKGQSVAGVTLGIITLKAVIVSFGLLMKWRKHHEMRYSQVYTLFMATLGYGFLAMAGIVGSVEPTDVSCVLSQWFTRIGYTVALVPILVKVSTVNKLTRAAVRLKRVEIDQHYFKRVLLMAVFAVLLFLTFWTVFDRYRQETYYSLILNNDDTDTTNLVNVHNSCVSRSTVWQLVAFGFEVLLLVAATILTYQSRAVIGELNESHSLAFMVYSHFLFLVMRLLVFRLMSSNMVPNALSMRIMSLLVSADALIAICIYLCPKFAKVITHRGSLKESRGIHIKDKKSWSRRVIAGINIPLGGIPNLIKKTSTRLFGIKEKETNQQQDRTPACTGLNDQPSSKGFSTSSPQVDDNNLRSNDKKAVSKASREVTYDSQKQGQLHVVDKEFPFKTETNHKVNCSSHSGVSGSEEEADYKDLLSSTGKLGNDFESERNVETDSPLVRLDVEPHSEFPSFPDETENSDIDLTTLRGEITSLREKHAPLLSRYSRLVHGDDEAKDSETLSLIKKEEQLLILDS